MMMSDETSVERYNQSDERSVQVRSKKIYMSEMNGLYLLSVDLAFLN